jgi:hypothetical protein
LAAFFISGAAMAFFLSPVLNEQQFDANGEPRAGALITTYLAGTLTAVTTYKTSTGTAHTNPIQLDSAGYYPNGTQLWLQGGFSYKFVITDSDGSNSRTYDNITGVGDDLAGIDEWILYSAAPTYISATSFSVAGDQTNIFQVLRRTKTVNSGGTIYSSIASSSFGAGITTVTVTNDSGVLDAGLSAVSYGLLSATNPSIPESTIGKALRVAATKPDARTAIGATLSGVRQTVQSGSVDSSGLPNFLTTSVNLNLPIAATSSNLIIAAAAGFNLNGPVDRIGIVTADTTLTLAASVTSYIYADVAAAGTITFGSTTLAPSYIIGGTPSTTNGQFTFDITKMTGYVGNGATAPQTYRVFIGEAVTSGSAVTSVVNYALNGRYAQVDAAIPTNTRLSKTHNVGVLPRVASVMLRCTVSDAGYAVGEDTSVYYSNGNVGTSSQTAYTIGIIFNVGTIAVVNKTSGAVANIAAGQWDTAFYVDRGW